MTGARSQEMLAQHQAGATLQEIGDRYGVTGERVRQIIRAQESGGSTAGGTPRRTSSTRARGRRRGGDDGERVRLRIGNLAKAVLVFGQAY